MAYCSGSFCAASRYVRAVRSSRVFVAVALSAAYSSSNCPRQARPRSLGSLGLHRGNILVLLSGTSKCRCDILFRLPPHATPPWTCSISLDRSRELADTTPCRICQRLRPARGQRVFERRSASERGWGPASMKRMLTGLHVHRLALLAVPLGLLALPLFIATGAMQQRQGRTGDSTVINPWDDPLLATFRFRSIGPASMGGRVDDIAVSESDPNIIYIGYAVGGVFKSENNGTTFEPVFETYNTASIGDIAIHPTNPNIVYVGTGEANNRQTSSFGDGIYKTD